MGQEKRASLQKTASEKGDRKRKLLERVNEFQRVVTALPARQYRSHRPEAQEMPLPQSTTLPSSGFGGYGTFNPLLDVTQKRSASAQTRSTTVLILKWSIIWDGLISYLEGKRRRGGGGRGGGGGCFLCCNLWIVAEQSRGTDLQPRGHAVDWFYLRNTDSLKNVKNLNG